MHIDFIWTRWDYFEPNLSLNKIKSGSVATNSSPDEIKLRPAEDFSLPKN